jgi:uncharacterized protein (UPF0332 family)
MKKIIFLTKLAKEGKIQLVEPSEKITRSYLEKAENCIKSAKLLLQNKLYENSVSMSYYAMYNSLLALFFKTGIKSENHNASIILLKELFDLDNSEISFSKRERLDKQYYINFKIIPEQVKEAILKAEIFNKSLIDFIAKISNEEIKKYREKFTELT